MIAIYARVSTTDQDPRQQIHALRQWIETHRPGSMVEEYIDHGVSGSLSSRPALDRLLARIRAKGGTPVSGVAVVALDRLGRSQRHLLDLLAEFRERDIQFLSLRENVDSTTPMGRAVLSILGVVAELERDLIVERTRAGVAKAKREGTRSGKPIGRPKSTLNLHLARKLHSEGRTQLEIATACRCSLRTIQRRWVDITS